MINTTAKLLILSILLLVLIGNCNFFGVCRFFFLVRGVFGLVPLLLIGGGNQTISIPNNCAVLKTWYNLLSQVCANNQTYQQFQTYTTFNPTR